ncbi:MAG: barstar family protein [Rhodococcus sp. (in: high G+C Gram-positive bacteria)]|uniref:barstar family protein n=1 Tax=Rhodococcus sp. TaxID=1831 RepID=UPI002ADD230F|nr:barstar family protein [Rhodococcus sp. (in: high G+C Gram-positive bacteria)]
MARKVVFDPTERELFDEQRQGFDWTLLQSGFVFRYTTRFQLDRACTRLTDLGYLVHELDAREWTSVEDMHTAFAASLSFPHYYGKNLDAFNDVLRDVATFSYGSDPATAGTVLAIANFDALLHIDHRTGRTILEIFASQARLAALYGHPMLCLVETTASDLGKVGDVDIYEGTVWDTPADPPDPFDEADVLEFGFQIYATHNEAADYASALGHVIAPVLGEIGRWQILGPALAPENSVRFHREHSSARQQSGQQFWDVFVSVRGVGDAMALGEEIFHAIERAGLHFEQMSQTMYNISYQEAAFEKYQELADFPKR